VSPPLISVLLPCFNDGEWIGEAMASVRAQTYQHFEIVVVDDGSTDAATKDALRRLQGPGIQLVESENRGLPGARNLAARHARGDLFCAFDADDRLAPQWFEKGVALLESRPEVAFVSHWLETFGDEQWTWTPASCELPALLARNTVNGAALVRRQAFEAVGGYAEHMRNGCEDWDFWLRLVEQGYHGQIIPEVLFFYRRRATSMSRLMTQDESYERPLRELVSRHEEAYSAHLIDVILAKEGESLALEREVTRLECAFLEELYPAMARAREERNALADKVARVTERVELREQNEKLTCQVNELRREVEALRRSWSWRIAAPLRRAYGLLIGERS
jgi:glycosyltransferase involved in cell wall biosynthesis